MNVVDMKEVENYYAARLRMVKEILTLSGFQSDKWVLGDAIFASVYPYLLQHKQEVAELFPNTAGTLDKFVGVKSKVPRSHLNDMIVIVM